MAPQTFQKSPSRRDPRDYKIEIATKLDESEKYKMFSNPSRKVQIKCVDRLSATRKPQKYKFPDSPNKLPTQYNSNSQLKSKNFNQINSNKKFNIPRIL